MPDFTVALAARPVVRVKANSPEEAEDLATRFIYSLQRMYHPLAGVEDWLMVPVDVVVTAVPGRKLCPCLPSENPEECGACQAMRLYGSPSDHGDYCDYCNGLKYIEVTS